jgi:soluble lytic murein transglycosylase
MQIMPATARQVAKDIKIEYSRSRLTNNWRYNAKLGLAYLGGLLDTYGGSYVLAFAAYNAGPNRVNEWIKTYGDPRDNHIDQVDWIEHIPYRETRNYVMRVIESLHVYRIRISGKVEPIRLTKDLTRG